MDLMLAIRHNDVEKVREILAARSDAVDEKISGGGGATPLHWAAEAGSPELLELLLESHQGNVNVGDDELATPLHWAAGENMCQCIQILVDKFHASVDARDCMGQSPLMWAALNGHRDACVALCERRAGVNLCAETQSGGQTSLHFCVVNAHSDAAAALLDRGALADVEDARGETAWQMAERLKNDEMVALFEPEGRQTHVVLDALRADIDEAKRRESAANALRVESEVALAAAREELAATQRLLEIEQDTHSKTKVVLEQIERASTVLEQKLDLLNDQLAAARANIERSRDAAAAKGERIRQLESQSSAQLQRIVQLQASSSAAASSSSNQVDAAQVASLQQSLATLRNTLTLTVTQIASVEHTLAQ
jgi:ankyrin repeat protein